MKARLTLRIEEDLIERAKSYSQRTEKLVSQLVADYFRMLPEAKQESGKEAPNLTPIVRSMIGVMRGANVDEEDYRRHLEERYR